MLNEYPFKDLEGLNNIEVEDGETIILQDGRTFKVEGKKHSKGGEMIFAPNGTKILSEKLKLPKELVKAITGKNTRFKASPASLSKKYDTQSFYDMLNNPRGVDDIRKRSAELMLEKNIAKQDTIFKAQEEYKAKKGMKNDADKAQMGNFVNPTVMERLLMEMQKGSISPFNDGTGVTLTYKDPFNPDKVHQYTDAFGNLDFIKSGKFKTNKGVLKGDNLNSLHDFQNRAFPVLKNPSTQTELDVTKAYADYLQKVELENPNEFKDIQLRVGNDLVSNILENRTKMNKGDGISINPILDNINENDHTNVFIGKTIDRGIDRLPTLPLNTLSSIKPDKVIDTVDPTSPVSIDTTYDDKAFDPSLYAKKGVDSLSLINALQMGTNLFEAANLNIENPFLPNTDQIVAPTRFEPINTKQSERLLNIAKRNLTNSNLPESVKQSQLSNLAGRLQQNTNQVDIQNFQGNLNNQNRNNEVVTNAVNQNRINRNQNSLNYLIERDRRRNVFDQTRVNLLTNALDIWKGQEMNKRDLRLVEQLANNYKYNPATGEVEYDKGQGTPTDTGILDIFKNR